MCMTIEECKQVGDQFMNQIADIVRECGFQVYTQLYIPYRPGADKYTEIDIIGISPVGIVTVECKHNSFPIRGSRFDHKWTRSSPYGEHSVANPLAQSWSHALALKENFGRSSITEFVVVSHEENYQGDKDPRVFDVVGFRARLKAMASSPVSVAPVNETEMAAYEKLLKGWKEASVQVRVKHTTDLIISRNQEETAILKTGYGIPVYCLMIGDYYYCFTDELGRRWGSNDIGEATLYEREEEAITTSWNVKDSIVCSMAFGYPEDINDLPSDLDGLTAAEIAEELGARPW